ncbi:PREDICTED: unnamed product [Prunus dulcis]|uniref:PREDICTED: unnamed product n=1 Tax=Prunus dulcis TaxID=3755 RepID=A0A5E4E3J0_PRUDU|nr:protein ALTERED PHOSPHATE STARVATION RESPONSE 1-like [Prunus dulcis]VVA09932.1 PREDICTED: unnamed product [Prunus dulcis]
MGGKVSKQRKRDDVVLLCRERKRQLNLAVKRRYAFADAQCEYSKSLSAVAVAIRSFVESHSSPSDSDSEPTKNTNAYPSSDSGISRSSSSEIDREKKLQENSDDREEVEENRDHNAGTDGEELGLVLLNDEAVREGRELLEALKEVEVQFLRAYNSSLDVTRMLGTNTDQMQSALEDTEENSSKLKKSRSVSSILSSSSSRKSLLRSSTRSSSTITPSNGGLFDDNGAMGSKCHSLTLGMLYVLEQKLYEEVKAGEETRRLYDRKCSQYSRNQGHGLKTEDKIRVELHSRIAVAKRSAESTFKKIRKLRDEELQPQLIELLQGLMKNWKIMSETHETQHRIMSEVKYVNCSSYEKLCNDNSHQLAATHEFEAELQNWRARFASYVSSQKEYIEALDGWLHKLVAPESEVDSDMWSSLRSCRVGMLPSTEICENWLASINKLPHKAVPSAMENFGKDVQALMVRQDKDHQQKRKIDGLAKELHWQAWVFYWERRIMGLKRYEEKEWHERLKKMENKVIEFKTRLNSKKEKLHTSMEETQNITVNRFQTGFSSVFKSLTEFSKSVVEMYDGLIRFNENGMKVDDKGSHLPSIHVEADDKSSHLPSIRVEADDQSSRAPSIRVEADDQSSRVPSIRVEADDQSSQAPRIRVEADDQSSQPPRVDVEADEIKNIHKGKGHKKMHRGHKK